MKSPNGLFSRQLVNAEHAPRNSCEDNTREPRSQDRSHVLSVSRNATAKLKLRERITQAEHAMLTGVA
jgi:hypothetical protein